MTAETETRIPDAGAESDAGSSPEQVIADLRAEVRAGMPWYPALLRAAGRWRLPVERVDGRQYTYLVGGEAFDWLLLAERLTDALEDLIPAAEREALVVHGRPPEGEGADPESFRQLIGGAKYRAHLNYQYGVVVEEALQLAVELDAHKELRCRVWGSDRRVDETVFERIYGHPRETLLVEFRTERGLPHTGVIGLVELREFTYWLFKYRVKHVDPARVASDTRRGLAQLATLEACRRLPAPATAPAPAVDAGLDTGIIEAQRL